LRAIIYTHYGPPEVLSRQEVAKPVAKDDEVLVRVHAAAVNRTDYATIMGIPFFARFFTGLFSPRKRIPGTAFSGTVEACGKNASSFKPGERVFGFDEQGACAQAEYLTIRTDKLVSLPGGITHEQAAASVEGAHYAYNFINKVTLAAGQQVLVNGATGAIGSAAVQLLKHFGAQVTAVCGTDGIEAARSLGADRVIDYQHEDFTQDTQRFDYVFDTVGKSSFFKCRRLLLPGGVYMSSDLGYLAQNIFLPLFAPLLKMAFGGRWAAFPMPEDIGRTLRLVSQLLEAGEFRPLIDRSYPLEQIVDAYRYVGSGQKMGNVVVTIWQGR
jgi:NADPH:quinone reductase-like Zn-dependent oxidoreductase